MRIQIGCMADSPQELDRLTLEQIDDGFAPFYELPWGEVAVVVMAKLTVLDPGC